jgi:23S rRNA G2069 N7-methylase RlmK/C1962 C5-methylase RlmI
VALIAAGAEEVVSVDLSRPYLDWMGDNLALNELDQTHSVAVKSEVRAYLERLPKGERFDGVILDPPTAAAAGRRYWSYRRDGEELLSQLFRHLAPGGVLLACRNTRRSGKDLGSIVKAGAARSRVELSQVQNAPPGRDHPRRKGFPEGDAFEGVLARRGGGK